MIFLTVAVVGVVAMILNVVFGPKLKRDSLCAGHSEGSSFSVRDFTSTVRRLGREPVIMIESSSGDSKSIEAPGPDGAEPVIPDDATGIISVNFGTQEDRATCVVRFKAGKVTGTSTR